MKFKAIQKSCTAALLPSDKKLTCKADGSSFGKISLLYDKKEPVGISKDSDENLMVTPDAQTLKNFSVSISEDSDGGALIKLTPNESVKAEVTKSKKTKQYKASFTVTPESAAKEGAKAVKAVFSVAVAP